MLDGEVCVGGGCRVGDMVMLLLIIIGEKDFLWEILILRRTTDRNIFGANTGATYSL